MAKIRMPTQAGMFYAGNPHDLKIQIEKCFKHKLGPGELPKVVEKDTRKIIGLVCPHAGYEYSGPVAAHAYHALAFDGRPDTVVILGPNHTGYGSALAIMNEGVWRTPLGDVEIDSEVAARIIENSDILDIDELAHKYEHSIEVQLPFLQFLYGSKFKFVPIAFLLQDLQSSREVGEAIAKALKEKNAVIMASSDMTHFEPQSQAERKDKMAIAMAEKMEEEKYYSIIETYNVSSCGYGPVIATITATKILGANNARLLCYKTSGDVTGDYSSVVGYAAISFTK
jgi:AmmeMemoRadiSam system protein B